MWWKEDRLTGPKHSSQRSLAGSNITKLDNPSRTLNLRSEPAHGIRTAQRPNRRNIDSFRSLDLSPDQRLANLELSAGSYDSGSSHPSEIKRLEADVRALEMIVRKGHADRQQQESELARLRGECSRWLSETQLLSEQLSVEAETRNQLRRQYENARAELQAIRVLPGSQARCAEKAFFSCSETESKSQDSQNKAA